jgi:hypothetical protein
MFLSSQINYLFKLKELKSHKQETSENYNIFDDVEFLLEVLEYKLLMSFQKRKLLSLIIEEFVFLHENMNDVLENPDDIMKINKLNKNVRNQYKDISDYIHEENVLVKCFVVFGYWKSLKFYYENFDKIQVQNTNKEKRLIPKLKVRETEVISDMLVTDLYAGNPEKENLQNSKWIELNKFKNL